jgi:hypothetical protein
MSTLLWILLVGLYIACFVILGVATFRKGHYFLFWVGIIFPILWIIGALMAPTPAAMERERSAEASGSV